MKQLACSVTALCLAVPQVVTAQSSLEFYGQLNFGIFNTDDGIDEATYFIDNDNSNTRVGFNWTNQISADRSLRFNFESSLGLTGSGFVSIEDNDLEIGYRRTELRKFELIYKTPSAGTFSFGQGSTATDGTAQADFSGTTVIAYSGIADLAGGIEFRNPDGSFSGVTVGDAFSSFEISRRFRGRYDTPSWNGLVFSISGGKNILIQDDESEYYGLAATYTADYGDIQVDARIGYGWISSVEELLVGSVAVLHEPTGLSIAVSAGSNQDGDEDYVYAKLGYQRDWFSVGRTFLSVDYSDGGDYAVDGSDSSSTSVAAVQNIDAHNMELYAIYRTHEFDVSGTDYEDVDVIAVGARWKF